MLTEEQIREALHPHFLNKASLNAAMEEDLVLYRAIEQAVRKEMEADLKDAFKAGWTRAADWGNRTDLWADIDSPQYIKEMTDELAQIDAAKGQT